MVVAVAVFCRNVVMCSWKVVVNGAHCTCFSCFHLFIFFFCERIVVLILMHIIKGNLAQIVFPLSMPFLL